MYADIKKSRMTQSIIGGIRFPIDYIAVGQYILIPSVFVSWLPLSILLLRKGLYISQLKIVIQFQFVSRPEYNTYCSNMLTSRACHPSLCIDSGSDVTPQLSIQKIQQTIPAWYDTKKDQQQINDPSYYIAFPSNVIFFFYILCISLISIF
jgi:hypothetical protein